MFKILVMAMSIFSCQNPLKLNEMYVACRNSRVAEQLPVSIWQLARFNVRSDSQSDTEITAKGM